MTTFKHLQEPLLEILSADSTLNNKLQSICNYLKEHISTYNWVGFYFRNGQKEELILGPYAGVETQHTIIPFGKGICGQVALSNKNFVVDDVLEQSNYISCNIDVKAEIVVPLFVEGENIGQIDIDSNTLKAFDKNDEAFLEWLMQQVSTLYKSNL